MSINVTRKFFISFLALAAVFFWELAIIGAFKSYSPVPFWDMWDGYLDFYVHADDIGRWWSQHNEHRIFLSRLLFWIDLSWFNGSIWFLLVVNYLLVAISCWTFFVLLRERLPKHYLIPGLLIMIWLISWSQWENLTWGFQSQFFLAQLLPLIAFFLLHRAYNEGNISKGYFSGACFFGVLSLGSMANGVIALPLMTLYAIICRFGWRWVAVLAGLSCFGLLAYFYDYTSPAYHGSIGSSLRENPVGLILYVMTYIGNPISHITERGVVAAQVAGGIMILLSAYFAWTTLRSARKSTLELALLFFILYIGGTALGTGVGRLFLGVEHALSSRYVTPSLMAWAALFVLAAPKLEASFEKLNWKLCLFLLLLICAMLPMQIKALDDVHANVFERNVAGLAVAMGIHDRQQINNIYPNPEAPLSIGKTASEKGLSYFSRAEFKDINIGKPVDGFSGAYNACQGYIDAVDPVEEDNNYSRVSGWMFDSSQKSSPDTVYLVNKEGIAVGYALTGQPRPDLVKAIDKKAGFSGFKGYVLNDAQGSAVTVFSPTNNCGFSSSMPSVPIPRAARDLQVSSASHCDGAIDTVNGSQNQQELKIKSLLDVQGWLAASVDAADVPDRVYLVLSSTEGMRYLIDTQRTQRPDVGAHFNKPDLNSAGYAATADVSKLFGQYHLGLAYQNGSEILVCPQFSIPIEINQD